MALGRTVFKNKVDYDNAKEEWLGAEAKRGARQDPNGNVATKDGGTYPGATPFSATPDKDGNTEFTFNPHVVWNYKHGDPDIKNPDQAVSRYYTEAGKKTFDDMTAKIEDMKDKGYERIRDMFYGSSYMQVLMSQNK